MVQWPRASKVPTAPLHTHSATTVGDGAPNGDPARGSLTSTQAR